MHGSQYRVAARLDADVDPLEPGGNQRPQLIVGLAQDVERVGVGRDICRRFGNRSRQRPAAARSVSVGAQSALASMKNTFSTAAPYLSPASSMSARMSAGSRT
ncbi:hypothetical protein A4G27_17845 [Mycobacterium kansasii]|nr:hypothetical protein A4G27_17845 [Mycobacterium kansasii]